MISVEELKILCTEHLEDARTLLEAKRLKGAFYICGYVVELGLKMRICRTLGWPGYPDTTAEFKGLSSFKTHDLEILLHLSGVEAKVKAEFFPEWSVALSWSPEIRYSSAKQTEERVKLMLSSSETLLKNL